MQSTVLKPTLWPRSGFLDNVILEKECLNFETRNDCEKLIVWKVSNGDPSFWWDNWVGIGPLAQHFPHTYKLKKLRVPEFITDRTWNLTKMHESLPLSLISQVINIEIYTETEISQYGNLIRLATLLASLPGP